MAAAVDATSYIRLALAYDGRQKRRPDTPDTLATGARLTPQKKNTMQPTNPAQRTILNSRELARREPVVVTSHHQESAIMCCLQ